MEKFVINGGAKLSGSLRVESAKNAVLPMLAGAILTDEKVIIKNCPKIEDVLTMIKILARLGVKTQFLGEDLMVDSSNINGYEIPDELGKELRSSVFMMGALISRFKKAKVSYPGGCKIGARPINLHLDGLKQMGVNFIENEEYIECFASDLKGCKIKLSYPSVGATENLMLSAVLAQGKTELHGVAKEPEIVDLMQFLNKMGAKVYGAGTSTILIEGVKKLHAVEYKPIADRIEAGTYLLSAVITGGEIEVNGCDAKNIYPLIHKLCDNTCKISIKNDIIYVKSGRVPKSFDFSTGPYPFFPTDLQAQTMVLSTISQGVSTIIENVFENRFCHVSELKKMGADISVKGRRATVNGVNRLHGAKVFANDLRGGSALVLAGLNAEGVSEIYGVNHIKRGYLNIDEKLRTLGANVKLQKE